MNKIKTCAVTRCDKKADLPTGTEVALTERLITTMTPPNYIRSSCTAAVTHKANSNYSNLIDGSSFVYPTTFLHPSRRSCFYNDWSVYKGETYKRYSTVTV